MCESDFDWILNDVAVGNIRAGSNLNELRSNGISVIICAIPILPYSMLVYKENGFSVFHIPIDDAVDVNIERWFDDVSDFIMAHRLMHNKVLIHCHAGMSRSVTLTCAFLMHLCKWNDLQALHWIRNKRPCISVNMGFLRQLSNYSKKINCVRN